MDTQAISSMMGGIMGQGAAPAAITVGTLLLFMGVLWVWAKL